MYCGKVSTDSEHSNSMRPAPSSKERFFVANSKNATPFSMRRSRRDSSWRRAPPYCSTPMPVTSFVATALAPPKEEKCHPALFIRRGTVSPCRIRAGSRNWRRHSDARLDLYFEFVAPPETPSIPAVTITAPSLAKVPHGLFDFQRTSYVYQSCSSARGRRASSETPSASRTAAHWRAVSKAAREVTSSASFKMTKSPGRAPACTKASKAASRCASSRLPESLPVSRATCAVTFTSAKRGCRSRWCANSTSFASPECATSASTETKTSTAPESSFVRIWKRSIS
mmetsp:Transcript_29584/g.101971  ORF Transcript_29584/g.101971 Transcript_29584/m.101971 type:complete len:284 (-) Transcript_29584:486-1337(-)